MAEKILLPTNHAHPFDLDFTLKKTDRYYLWIFNNLLVEKLVYQDFASVFWLKKIIHTQQHSRAE